MKEPKSFRPKTFLLALLRRLRTLYGLVLAIPAVVLGLVFSLIRHDPAWIVAALLGVVAIAALGEAWTLHNASMTEGQRREVFEYLASILNEADGVSAALEPIVAELERARRGEEAMSKERREFLIRSGDEVYLGWSVRSARFLYAHWGQGEVELFWRRPDTSADSFRGITPNQLSGVDDVQRHPNDALRLLTAQKERLRDLAERYRQT
jgi:hypothetical protein